MKKNKSLKLKLRGMTFIEAIMGIFIFALVMFAVTSIFTSSFWGYKKAEKMAKNIESAQFAINMITKSLRTSKVISFGSGGSSILAYDYSEVRCNEYVFNSNGTITRKYKEVAYGVGVCENASGYTAAAPITTQYVYGSFYGSSSNGSSSLKTMGRVTIRVKVCSEADCPIGGKSDVATLQTTASLRDYSTVGL